MKEIYVYKQMFGGWTAISKEEAEEKIQSGHLYGAELEVDRGDHEPIKIIVLKDLWTIFGATDEMVKALIDEYTNYVESITGMVSIPTQ